MTKLEVFLRNLQHSSVVVPNGTTTHASIKWELFCEFDSILL
jgi:hypothetical protein